MVNPMVNYATLIEETNSRHYNVADIYKDNSIEENIEICKKEKRNFSVGVINITGELNVGMMIRSACLFGAEKFYIFGRKKFDKRSTVGAENYIDIVQYTYDDPIHADELIRDDIWQLHSSGKHSVVLCEHGGFELRKNSKWGRHEEESETTHPLFLFGSESHGIPACISAVKFPRVSIPQLGVMRSFNVSSAMAIVCWDFIKECYL